MSSALRYRRLLLALLLGAGVWPRPAAAQFRYLVTTDVHEKYDSNVFAGISNPSWDMLTEIEPGFRAYYYQRAALLWLSYRFTLQTFARTDDPSSGRKLLGYANRMHLEYTKLFSPSTGIRLFTRFGQGTENVQIPGGVTPLGAIEAGYLSTGSKFIADDSRLELQHLWNPRWSSRWHLDGSVYRAFGRSTLPTVQGATLIAPPDSWSIAPTHRLDYALENNVVHQETTFTTLQESRPEYPRALVTLFLDVSAGWRHYFTEFWDANLSAGLDLRARQLLTGVAPTQDTYFQNGVGPIGGAGIRYRRPREVTVALEYSHIYALTVELGAATTADTDQVALLAEWMFHTDWLFEASSTFRYLRMALRQANANESTTKVLTARAVLAYRIMPGLSVDLGYDLEMVRNRPFLGETGQPGLNLLPFDYTRHIVGIGVSVAWPPIPREDTQLTRRVSESEPIFTLGPHGAAAAELRNADDDLMRERAQRAERRRREREMRQQEPDQPSSPMEELFENPPPP